MIERINERGRIRVSDSVYTKIAGNAATGCFGVKGMAVRNAKDGLVHLLRRESMSKGLLVTVNEDSSIDIEMHIMIDQGVNIPALGKSIVSEVRYLVSKQAQTEVRNVDVYIDSMVIG